MLTRRAWYSETAQAGLRSRVYLWIAAAIVLMSVVPFALQSMPVAHAASNAIQLENQNPGDPTWNDFASVAKQDAINGYASPISVNHGQSVDFYITTTAATYTIKIYRTGWYGGAGARLMQGPLGPFTGVHQAIPAPDPVTGMVSCDGKWQKSYTLSVPSNWTSGVYLARLDASNGDSSFIYFVVRNDGGTEAIEFQTSVTTYHAYNTWGGVSLYDNQTNGTVYKYAHATKVSFDRPFNPLDDNGAGNFLEYEYPFIRWAESQGYDLTYITDVDTHTNVNPLTNHKAFLSVGHDEYWSRGMRTNVQNAINAGVNVAFFSANTMYWQIRFEANTDGVANRVEVGYKDYSEAGAPGPDPQWGVNNAIVTDNWRSPVVNQPENAVIGVMYDGQVPNNNYPFVVQNASNWVYAGTGFTNGTSLPGIVGYEFDKVWNNGYSPAGLTTLSNSPVCCGDSAWDPNNNTTSQATIYTAASGARVFAGGTIDWSWGLDNYSATGNYVNAGFQKMTANILANFTSGSAPAAPAVTLSPTSLTFASQTVNTTSSAQVVTLSNTGNATLNISGISIVGTNAGDFAQTNTCGSTLAAPGSCTISVTFTPTATGTRTASVSIADNANGSPQTVPLTGTGAAAPAPAVTLSPTSLAFGNQNVGTTSAAKTVTLTNSGNAALSISGIALTGTNAADFAQTNTCPISPSTLAAGANCTISVTFTPSTTSAETAAVSITDNASGSPQSVSLSGTGVQPAPGVNLSPTSLSFGNQNVGTTSAAQTVTLTNNGTSALTITSIGVTGTNAADFAQTNTCPLSPSTLAAGANCTISVTFTPTATGTRTASLSVADNASGSPQTVALSGTGVAPTAPAVTLSPTSVAFGNQAVGSTSTAQTITLTDSGTGALTITSISVSGTNAADFAQTNTCPVSPSTLAAGANCTISVTFKPSIAGSETASLSIADNAAGSPQSVGLSGTGVNGGTYFADGFESGNFSAWTGQPSGNGQASVENTVVNSGSYAAAFTIASGQFDYMYANLSGGGQQQTYTRFYVRLSGVTASTMLAYGKDVNGNKMWEIDYDASRHGLDVYFWNGARSRFDLYSNTNIMNLDTWYSVELQDTETTTGTGQVWLNGTSIGSVSGDLSATSYYAQLNLYTEAVGTTYWDDVVVSSAF